MITKLKIVLFNTLKEIQNWFSGTGISKIPGVSIIYDFLFQIFWPQGNIIEIQGSKMYVNTRKKMGKNER